MYLSKICGRIKLNQGQSPLTRNGPSAQTFATALHAENDYALGRLKAEFRAFVFPGAVPQSQPILEIPQPTDAGQESAVSTKSNMPVRFSMAFLASRMSVMVSGQSA